MNLYVYNQYINSGGLNAYTNYLIWRGLVNYGFEKEADELAVKTIILFGKDFGDMEVGSRVGSWLNDCRK